LSFLKAKNIEVVVDVRAFPRSRIKGFSRDELKRELEKNGLEYVWLGDKLGGFRRGGYEGYTKEEGFKRGLEILSIIARDKRVCLMCLERDRRFCHRRFIVEKLKSVGFEVKDLVRGD
ncbi:MAG: DUF488 domain-containing protein, partial [Candidatus Nezhaarchaeales archaeon]